MEDQEQELELETPQEELAEDESHTPWFLADADDVIGTLETKESEYFEMLQATNMVQMYKIAWAQYFGTDPNNPGQLCTQVAARVGEEREYTRLRINEARSFLKQAIQTATSTNAAYKVVTSSRDFASIAGVDAADRAVTATMRKCFDARKKRKFLERMLVLGSAFVHVRWDPEGGDKTIDTSLGIEQEVMSGAPVVQIGCPWDGYYDAREEDDLTWVVMRERRSKWELAALYPEHADKLAEACGEDKFRRDRLFNSNVFDAAGSDEGTVTLQHFYLAKQPGAENGRYIGFVQGVGALWDRELPITETRKLPVYLAQASTYIGANIGYADWWDVISIQQTIDNVVSDWTSSMRAQGRLNMYVAKGSGINLSQMSKGLRVFELDPGAVPPGFVEPPKLAAAGELLQYLHTRMEQVTQQNSVRRGSSDNMKSGTMAALYNQQGIEAIGDVLEAAEHTDNAVANIVLDMLTNKSRGSFLIEVSGESERPYYEAFASTGLKGARSVRVENVSPMMRSAAGRFETFNAIAGLPPDRVGPMLRGLDTGDWSGLTEQDKSKDLRIVKENEMLLHGQEVIVGAGDDPVAHVKTHWSLLEKLESVDPTVIDPMTGEGIQGKYDAVKRVVVQHILKHLEGWQYIDPRLASLLGIAPPPPMPGSPTGDLMMMTGGMGAPQPQQQSQDVSAAPAPEKTPTGPMPAQPEPAQPPEGIGQ